MALYSYEGKKSNKEIVTGSIRGNSISEVQKKLRESQIKAISIIEQEQTLANMEIQLFNKISLKQVAPYLQQMSTLINAGITVLDASMMLEKQTKKGKFQLILEEVRKDLENGESLSASYRKHPNAFPTLLVSVISVAELSGALESNLQQMAKYYEKTLENKSSMITAMMYPLMMLLAAVGVGVFLMVSIVPMFAAFFESFNAPLPAITKATMAISAFISTKGYIIVLALIVIISSFSVAKRNPVFKLKWDAFKLKIPVFGEFIQKSDFAVFMTTMSTLLSSSVPMVNALKMSKDVASNGCIREVISKCELEIEQGGRLSNIFLDSPIVPMILSQMVEIGEKTGSLEDMLARLSIIFEKEVDESSKRIKTVLEPLVMVVIAGIVGFIVAAIMLPMFSMYTTIQG
ncbi:type II secretion system F family protein [Isobaculum melis]|uniref:Type IV pilus assembly protein PilC n=1 Tax=Isobaculum melis TaxID=142588 RepID=A0A1H9S3A2_9LACT|nr:type II secretion system F family protein [Isobaculum melis]SER79471.1 type IV pilus assembly protein PilC [Isobaculum melis]